MRRIASIAVAALALGAPPAMAQVPLTFPAPARIVFAAAHGDGASDLYTVGADGSDRRRLTTASGGHGSSEPVWAPGGGQVAFVRDLSVAAPGGDDDDEVVRSQIWTMRPDGSEQRPFAPPSPRDTYDSTPAWSPDGARVAFARVRFGGETIASSLVVTGADGAGQRTLARAPARTFTILGTPAWSPDGGTVLYTLTWLDEQAYYRSELYAVPSAGGTPRRIARHARDPAWSPDGRRIAFVSERDRNGERCGSDQCSYAGELYVMNADGSGRARLTNGSGDEGAPSWSADGSRIAFHSDRNYPEGEAPELYSIQPDGGCLTWLTNGTAHSGDPSWEPGSAPTDPGGCGATPREPLIETDVTPATSFRGFPVYWLGRMTADGLLISRVSGDGRGGVHVGYDDCARYEPSECPPYVTLDNVSTCVSHPLFRAGYQTENVTRVSDGLLYRDRTSEGHPELYAGPTTVRLFADDERRAAAVVPALRQANGEAEPGRFPLAQLPLAFWRRIERASAARRKYGTAGAARRLKQSRGAVKERVAIHRRLRELGRFGRLACPRR